VGLLQAAGALGLGLVGLQYLDVGTSALIFYTMPLWLVTIEWTIDRQMQSLVDLIALTCGMLGLGMVASVRFPWRHLMASWASRCFRWRLSAGP
jgi:drug/metabolite transporter (DMT)-like permease